MRLVRAEDFLRGHCVGAELIGAHFPMSPDEDAALVALGWHHPTPTDGDDYVRFWPDDVPLGPFLPRDEAERAAAMVAATFRDVLAVEARGLPTTTTADPTRRECEVVAGATTSALAAGTRGMGGAPRASGWMCGAVTLPQVSAPPRLGGMAQTRPAQRRARSLPSAAVAALVLVGGAALGAAPAAADKPGAGHCARIDKVVVKGAERTETACLDDLTTTGTVQTGHTNPADWAGLHAAGTVTPSGVPGIQVDGYFPDTSTTNTNHGWNHDSQFVIRIPDAWNGKVVITGAPGVRGQYANDLVIGDWVLAQGYAFASTDKGNMGASFWDDGSTPGGSIREWHQRVTELAVATRDTVTKVRAHRPEPDVHGRHLQRRLPHPLAAGEPPRPLRRRARLGGNAVPRRRPEPVHLPADRAEELPGVRRDR